MAVALAFCSGLFGAAAALRTAHPRPFPYDIEEKEKLLEKRGDEIDTLFIGSSRIYRHVIPAEFDRQTEEAGRATRSFNFGVDGLRPPESFYYANRILARRGRLKWVFVELCSNYTALNERLTQNERTVEWHDLPGVITVLRALFHERLSLADKLLYARRHLQCFFIRTLNSGGGLDLFRSLRGLRAVSMDPSYGVGNYDYGFVPDGAPAMTGAKKEQFEADVANARQRMHPLPLPSEMKEAVRHLAQEIRAHGAVPVFVTMPTVRFDDSFAPLRPQGIDAELISLADPQRFPELYDPALRCDIDHFVGRGPKILTVTLAGEFLKEPAKLRP